MEILKDKNFEVLYFLDKIDEFVLHNLDKYDEKKLKSIQRGDLNLNGKEKREEEKDDKAKKPKHANLMESIKKNLGDKVSDVKISHRLKTSAVCLVSSETG
ncbi:unnamed protein product, partial [marine sediment metagenome]